MRDFKGTQGEWYEHREGFSTVYVESRLRQGVIQEVTACGPTEGGSDEQYANARLISAAPDLLEALQELYTASFNSNQWTEQQLKSFGKAQQAINKALGGE